MKKRTIWMMLGLMTIALLGVIAVQVYWLARASSLEERLFKERVNQAMERVVRQLEAREMKAQVMKSLSDVRRTVNDAKAHQFKVQREAEWRKAEQQKLERQKLHQTPAAPVNPQFAATTSENTTSKVRTNRAQGKSEKSPRNTFAQQHKSGTEKPLTTPPEAASITNTGVQGESGSFEMNFNNGTFSFRSERVQHGVPHGATSRTQSQHSAPHGIQPRTAPQAPPIPQPRFVVTLPSEDGSQPVRVVIPNNSFALWKKDSLAERIKSRFKNYRRSAKSSDKTSEKTFAGDAATGAETSANDGQPYIGGRKTLEDRMNGGARARYEEYRAAQLQRDLARSQRDLERLRKLNVMSAEDMRALDSTFNGLMRQSLRDFGAFGFEFRIPNMHVIVPAPAPAPEQASDAFRDSQREGQRDSLDAAAKAERRAEARRKRAHPKANTDNLNTDAAMAANIANAQPNVAVKPAAKASPKAMASANTSKREPFEANMIARDTIEKIIDRVDFVENIMETMLSGKRVVTERVAMNDLDSLLRKELQHNDISEVFEYGIMRGASGLFAGNARNHDSMMIVNTAHNNASQNNASKPLIVRTGKAAFDPESTQKNLLASKFRAQMFPNDLFASEEHYLVVHFPKHDGGLSLAAIGSEVSLSAIFLLMIVGCFGFTLVALLKQKKLSDMKTDFINNMTHELKTPIATISIASEALKDTHVRSEGQRVERFVNIIHDENKRLAGHVEKVLQAAQMDRGDLKLNLTTTDVHTLVETAAESLTLQLEQKNGSIELHLDAANPCVEADETHLTNVIFNLLDNANKYTPDAPHLVISTRNTAQGIAFTVQDNGIGMTREAQKHIFEKFYRVPTGNRHDVKGFGLGLNYVQTIVEAHGGSISVKSDLGKGSTFEVLLPFAVKHRTGTGV